MILENLKIMLVKHSNDSNAIQIGYLKEVIQAEVLNYIYSNEEYSKLIFYGGTAMRFLLGLNRLSEDLGFVYSGVFDYQKLANDISAYFLSIGLVVDTKIQKFRITIKFRGILEQFGIQYQNSNDLYIKIEISDHFDFCKNFTTQIYPINYNEKSFFINSLEPSTLFATKLNAVLYRKREKKGKNDLYIRVKGRDFYDLFRYLQRGTKPNISCIKGIHTMEELKNQLTHIVENVDFNEVVLDVVNFVEDQNMVNFMKTDGKRYILEKIQER
ncbi:MAG: nucleotidyl transferase AbiEii/AbiGii toxin family protein [Candidatus Absconditabacterales bacterium]|nr:nucleotidyl transferase AbiEii/AbiGii toxin family protein [Candidatus Absconditabacterales bacterium]